MGTAVVQKALSDKTHILCAQRGAAVETKPQIYVSSVTEFPGGFIVKQNFFLSLSFIPTNLYLPRRVQIVCPGFRHQCPRVLVAYPALPGFTLKTNDLGFEILTVT